MATTPRATTTVSDTAGAVASGLDTVCVLAPVAVSADIKPRQFGGAAAIFEQHGYSEGVEYAALHARRTRKPILFIGLPIATPGVVGRENTSGNSGDCVTTVTAGSAGVLSEHDGIWTVITGGVIGTDQILLGLSLDGGRTTKRVRLGTANSYAIPFVNVTTTFGAGTLVAGDTIHTWHGTGPRSNAAGWAAARTALAAEQKSFRSALLIGDLQTGDEASDLLDEVEAYATENERFTFIRASVRDREPLAELASVTHRMTGAPTVTFLEVGATGDTITRSAGSFIADGFAVGDIITVAGAEEGDNNGTYAAKIAGVSATVLTLATDDVVNEGPTAGVTIVGEASLTFSNSADTITRSAGSWLADGFRVGDNVTISGTSGGTNDGAGEVTAVTATVLTLDTGDVSADEVIGATAVTITAGQTKAAWAADIDSEFESIDDAPRISLAGGRGRPSSPFSGWRFRRPAAWVDSIRSFEHDVHRAPWQKDQGNVGWDLNDADGNLAEYDDRPGADGGALSAGRFTSLRTYSNDASGAFITLSLTRASEGSVLSYTHNQAVTDVACTIVQAATENFIGRTPEINDDGTLTDAERKTLESEVNSALTLALLQNRGEGKRASKAVWTASDEDILNVPEASVTGVLDLNLNGTIHSVNTTTRVRSGGQ